MIGDPPRGDSSPSPRPLTPRGGEGVPSFSRYSKHPLTRRGDSSTPSRGAGLRPLLAGLWLFLAAGTMGFGPPALGDGDPFSAPIGSAELSALRAAPVIPGSVGAVAATIVDAESGRTLASRNADARLAPASLAKMMTALVALDRAALVDPMVATLRSRSEPSIIGLEPGDTLSLEDMLYGLLLPSGNDAALAIAETVGGGSIERFVAWMNERAVAMGLKNTRFVNPNGLDDVGQYSSARDLAEIATAVMAEPQLARIVGTQRRVVQAPPQYFFANTNPLLGRFDGLDGVKTGFTDEAGRSFAASATRNGQRIVTVVLNSPDIAQETRTLLQMGFTAARRTAIEVPRPGFARLREADPAQAIRPTIALTGWELPLLRAFKGGTQTTISMAGKPIAHW